MQFEKITSKQNDRIKKVIKLHDKKDREKLQLFIVEGLREIQNALNAGIIFEEIFFCRELNNSPELEACIQKFSSEKCIIKETSRDVFEKMSVREGPDGILGIAQIQRKSLSDIHLPSNPLILVAEGIEKPGNLGALIRTAEAAGVHLLLVADNSVDIFSPHVIRTSQGLVFKLPIVVSSNQNILDFLSQKNIPILLTTPHTRTSYWEQDMTQPTAILVGSEKDGVSEFWLTTAKSYTQAVTIPMPGTADSLNVNAAATIVLFEAAKQRFTQKK